MLRVHHQINRADVRPERKSFSPGATAIARAEDTALVIVGKEMAHGRDVNYVRIAWMDYDAGYVLSVGKTHICPSLSAVGGLVDAVAGE
jgi:hypothetical protein